MPRITSRRSPRASVTSSRQRRVCRNRRFFDEIIGRELQRHRRYDIPISMLFVDIDRFKAVNDTLGHEAGDMALKALGGALRTGLRRDDAYRLGGDEFAVVVTSVESRRQL